MSASPIRTCSRWLEGERIHQWLGARFTPDGTGTDFQRIERQKVFVQRLVEEGFDSRPFLGNPDECVTDTEFDVGILWSLYYLDDDTTSPPEYFDGSADELIELLTKLGEAVDHREGDVLWMMAQLRVRG